jgi:hypothetical protein
VDGFAYYHSLPSENTVRFLFTPAKGDFTTSLEAKSLIFDTGSIYSNSTGVNVSTAVPYFDAGPRYMNDAPSSLGFNSDMQVSDGVPQIISLTSPNASGIYTEGDTLAIHIVYDLPVRVEGGDSLSIQLSTGKYDRRTVFLGVSADSHTLVFLYTVGQFDVSPDLDALSYSAFTMGSGGAVFRRTLTNETIANTTLPRSGAAGSLSANKDLVINTDAPQIITILPVSRTGVYTAGDNLDFEVTYESAVTASGSPRLLIQNVPRQLDATIVTAPYLPTNSYLRPLVAESCQIRLSFAANWALSAGDVVVVKLPQFQILEGSIADSVAVNRTMRLSDVMIAGEAVDVSSVTGLWNQNVSSLYLTVAIDIDESATLELTVDGKNSIYAPAIGVSAAVSASASYDSSPSYSVVSSAVSSAFTADYTFGSIGVIGFTSLEFTVSPPAHDYLVKLTLDFTVPDILQVNDTITLHMPGFTSTVASFADMYAADTPYFGIVWDRNSSDFTITVSMNTSLLTHSVVLTSYVPFELPTIGVTPDSITFSASIANLGVFTSMVVPTVPMICSFVQDITPLLPTPSGNLPPVVTSVVYAEKYAGAVSAVHITWRAGPADLVAGDVVQITLPGTPEFVRRGTAIAAEHIQGASSALFTGSIRATTLAFTALVGIPAWQTMQLVLTKELGLKVFANGIVAGTDNFKAILLSKACAMRYDQLFYFNSSNAVVATIDPTVTVSPANQSAGLLVDSLVSIDISFKITQSLYTGDVVMVHVPGFTRPVEVVDSGNVTSNANVTMRFDRFYERLEFTLESDFIDPSSLSIALSRHLEVSSPPTGIYYGMFTLSIDAAAGSVVNQPMASTQCVGVCALAVDYSSLFVDASSDLTFTLSYSQQVSDETSISFLLVGFELDPDSALEGYAFISNGADASNVPLGDRMSLMLTWASVVNVATGVSTVAVSLSRDTSPPSGYKEWANVIAYTAISYRITGVKTTAGVTAVTPAVQVVDLALGGTILKDAPTSTLEANLVFERAALEFPSEEMLALEFEYPSSPQLALTTPLFVLSTGDMLMLSLTDFVETGAIVSATSNGDSVESAWDASSSVLFLTLITQPDSSLMRLSFDVIGLASPIYGLAENSTDVSYFIVLESYNASTALVVPSHGFEYVEEKLKISNTSVELAFTDGTSGSVDLTSITVSFQMNFDLGVGDEVTLVLPGIIQSGTPASVTVASSPTTFAASAVWTDGGSQHGYNSSLLLVVSSPLSAGDFVTVSVDASTASLYIGIEGISNTNKLTIVASHSPSHIIGTFIMPCVGICSASLTPRTRKAGYAPEYVIEIKIGSLPLTIGDQFSFALDSFSAASEATRDIFVNYYMDASSAWVANDDTSGTNITAIAQWDAASSTLLVNITGNPSNATIMGLNITLQRQFGLKLPLDGVRPSAEYVIGWTATLGALNNAFLSDIMTIPSVGKISYSSVNISPVKPDVAVTLDFDMSFLDPLYTGDEVYIYLANWTLPAIGNTVVVLNQSVSFTIVVGDSDNADKPDNFLLLILLQDVAYECRLARDDQDASKRPCVWCDGSKDRAGF